MSPHNRPKGENAGNLAPPDQLLRPYYPAEAHEHQAVELGCRRHPVDLDRERRAVMMKRALLPVAAIVLAASCSSLHTTSLELGVGAGYADAIFEMEWPAESGEHVRVNQSLTDSAGFASIEVEVRVPGAPPRILTAIDFLGRLNNTIGGIEVPKEGTASIFVELYQHGELVAEGHTSWPLDCHTRVRTAYEPPELRPSRLVDERPCLGGDAGRRLRRRVVRYARLPSLRRPLRPEGRRGAPRALGRGARCSKSAG